MATTTIPADTETEHLQTDDQIIEAAQALNVKPLWKQMDRLNPPLPDPKCVPFVWRFKDIRPFLVRAGEVVSEKQAERRVLMLVNPARDAPYTTDTLFGGLQLVMPNETAPAHRHSAFAMRFIIEGQGGFTAVHGQRINMRRGDVILTPTWNWHDHGKDGSGPMIWLDGLDLPNFCHFPVHFVEHYKQPRYEAVDVDSNDSEIVFPWHSMQSKLDSGEKLQGWRLEEYLGKDGQAVSKTLGGTAEIILPGAASPAIRETASSIYHVVEGSGFTEVDGQRIEWERGDTFCVPAWKKYRHVCKHPDSGSAAYLYRFHDRPMLKALGLYRVEGDR
ncbi:hypothetical protein RBB50_002124 [Rhinocladiella similis]